LKQKDPDDFTKGLGAVFRAERERQKLSKNQLSRASGVGRTGVLMFERGERVPTVFVCKALANALGMKLSTLVRRAEELEAKAAGENA
jgi:transcriptional regulator with XRE-family HTH domain